MIEEESIQLLKRVGLEDVKNAQVASFSGGMKRRLSVAISVIGNPKIIFLDEPTTGMDPVSRRDVWALI
jgi:ABC-type multidrug transport system ATPase subunit